MPELNAASVEINYHGDSLQILDSINYLKMVRNRKNIPIKNKIERLFYLKNIEF
jgi:hypothetical protein